jgi:hypothetical protein
MSTVTKRRISSPKRVTKKKVANGTKDVSLTLAGVYTGNLLNKMLTEFIDKSLGSKANEQSSAQVSRLKMLTSEYGAPSALFATGVVAPMMLKLGKGKAAAESLFKGMALYGGAVIVKNALGKNLLSGRLGTVTTNYQELNAARVAELPMVSQKMVMSV